MKKNILGLTLVVAMGLFSCTETPYINTPGNNDNNLDSIPVLIPDTDGIEVSVDSAILICKGLVADAVTGEKYKISGVITKNSTNPLSVPSYTNINFDISDNGGKTSLSCYYTNNLNNVSFRNSNQVPRVGSKVTVLGALTNYKGSTPEMKEGFIVRIDSMVAPGVFPGCPEPKEGQISVSTAVKEALKLPDGTESSETYDILGVVTEVLSIDAGDYGNAEWIMSDGKAHFYVYRGYKGPNKTKFASKEELLPNDTIVVRTKLYNYKGIAETKANVAYIIESTNFEYNN